MNENLELEPEVVEAIISGQKINAIKQLRELRGIDLKEAKELVDLYASQHKIRPPSVKKVNSNNGLIVSVIIAVLAYFFYQNFS